MRILFWKDQYSPNVTVFFKIQDDSITKQKAITFSDKYIPQKLISFLNQYYPNCRLPRLQHASVGYACWVFKDEDPHARHIINLLTDNNNDMKQLPIRLFFKFVKRMNVRSIKELEDAYAKYSMFTNIDRVL